MLGSRYGKSIAEEGGINTGRTWTEDGKRQQVCHDVPCIGYLDHPFKNRHVETEKDLLFPACKLRRVGVQSDVVNSILMLEPR